MVKKILDHRLESAVAAIVEARRTGTLLPPLPTDTAPRSVEEAYAVQDAVGMRSGETRGGWKIGCTSEASQRNLGSDGPIMGPMAAHRIFASGVTLSDVRMDMLIVEAEFAFRMGADLPPRTTDYGREEVLAALDTLHPAIELVQSRFAESMMPIIGIITDDAGAGSLILGDPVNNWRDMDLPGQAVSINGPDGVIASGHGSDVLGDPVNAMVWAANFLSTRGIGLRVGEIVTTGTCFRPPLVQADVELTADFGQLGACTVHFRHP